MAEREGKERGRLSEEGKKTREIKNRKKRKEMGTMQGRPQSVPSSLPTPGYAHPQVDKTRKMSWACQRSRQCLEKHPCFVCYCIFARGVASGSGWQCCAWERELPKTRILRRSLPGIVFRMGRPCCSRSHTHYTTSSTEQLTPKSLPVKPQISV